LSAIRADRTTRKQITTERFHDDGCPQADKA